MKYGNISVIFERMEAGNATSTAPAPGSVSPPAKQVLWWKSRETVRCMFGILYHAVIFSLFPFRNLLNSISKVVRFFFLVNLMIATTWSKKNNYLNIILSLKKASYCYLCLCEEPLLHSLFKYDSCIYSKL